MADKRKKLKRQVSNDGGQTWQDMIPYEYIAGELIERDSPDCNNIEWRTVSGYICEENTTEMTQWVADTGYVCVGFDKYNKEKEQVSYNSGISWADTGNTRAGSTLIEQNSEDCGYVPPTPNIRWVADTGYMCVGYDKYNKEKEQQSTDGGEHWTDTGNTRAGSTLIESDSTDCGYTPSHDYSRDYLTISSLEDNNEIKWKALSYNCRKTISVSTDNGQTWTAKTSSDTTTGSTLATLNAGDKLLLKGLNSTYSNTDAEPSYFKTTKNFSVYGNIMSLIGGDNFANITSFTDANEHAFSHLFWSCSHLVDASNLILPATTLAEGCYEYMFIDCTSLTTAPALPATTLAEDCYYCMFQGCTSLTSTPALPATTLAMSCYAFMFQGCTRLRTAPALPATTLAVSCYSHMFHSCTRLTTAPVLPATTLTSQCYTLMFYDCRNLNYIKCLATIFASYSTSNWLENVAATGTFVKAHSMTDWGTGDSGIPSGWTVVDVPEMTRWVADTGYMCVGTDKYNKEKEQGSNDGGTTWTDTGNIKAGSTLIEANSADCGYSTQYLTTEALNSGNISLNKYTDSGYESKEPITNIQYSKNGGDWTPYTYSTNIAVVTGDEIRWKGTFKDGNYNPYEKTYYSYFGATADYNVYGNPLSLLRNDDFVNEPDAIYEYAYYRLFWHSSTLKDASNLALPAMRLAYFCYEWMFYGCTSLTAAPALPATTLANYCYVDMFYGCTSLTAAPALPATTLAVECYYRMFGRCTSLNYIKCLATNISASNCTYSWVENVASTGIFVKPSSMSSWGTGDSGIPSGWTVQNA